MPINIKDTRKYFLFSEKILGYNPCEINTRNLHLLLNAMNLNSCLIAKIYYELSNIIEQLAEIENALGLQPLNLNENTINSIISCFNNIANIGNPNIVAEALNGGEILVKFIHDNNYAYNAFLFTIAKSNNNNNTSPIFQSIYFRNTIEYRYKPNEFSYFLNYDFKATGMLGIILNNSSSSVIIKPKPPLPEEIKIINQGPNNAKIKYNNNLIVSNVRCQVINSANQIIHQEDWGVGQNFTINNIGNYKIKTYYVNNSNIFSEKIFYIYSLLPS